MNKTINHKGWLFVLPVVVLVAFNAIIPLMTVVNFSVQESFGDNVFFWSGMQWFEQVLHSDRFHAALLRQTPFHRHRAGHRGSAWSCNRARHAPAGLLGFGLPRAHGPAAPYPVECGRGHVEHFCTARISDCSGG